ncbi:MAG: malto-oligosyltrehalose trehalohydrolase [Gammaproteobacteria bacterium]|nr:malto-oligosyltrehalose trehalohydrolase [Gammaproteobacteria bacterium]
MPFGAELIGDAAARFSLWAPSAREVELCVWHGVEETRRPMQRAGDGWYAVTAEAIAGDRYCYRIDGELSVADPASRFQPDDVHGPSELIDPRTFVWQDDDWRGRPWEEAVLYELHVGSFTAAGSYAGVQTRLMHLRDLGVTAIELMPLADFPGRRNWGYDGVLPFAPDSRYGRPEDLKALIQSAHRLGLMVFLDVVYNHFGPDGNYLHRYAAPFFTERHHTPWGAAINFDDAGSRVVRDYYIHNALYWLEEYHFDGLRFDAVHAIADDSSPDILTELAQAVARGPGARRQIHLVLENDDNAAHYLQRDASRRPQYYTAQWNDDIHHALHVIATGESGGYYADYADKPLARLGRCLTEGFAYQGEPSRFRDGSPRGEPSADLPPAAFVSFLQNHDQIGNRAFGERITALSTLERVRAVSAVFLLAPATPMLFMGQEWAARTPFPFFCDFGPELAAAVAEGRRKEFARFPEFSDPAARARIPDPTVATTFVEAVLNWEELGRPEAVDWLVWHRDVLALRAREIVPRLSQLMDAGASFEVLGTQGLTVQWALVDGSRLCLIANLSGRVLTGVGTRKGRILYRYMPGAAESSPDRLPPWSVIWWLEEK